MGGGLMSESTDAQRLIAKVLRNSVVMNQFPADWPEKTAAEIDKALGTLTRVERWVPVEASGHRWAPRDEASAQAALALHGERGPMHDPDCDSPLIRIDHESRWVSNWMEMQPHA
ncbi:hypothetical protein QEH38_gp77 [Mycobacterium phage LilSpotty]|uniref:Uncharacterized protein n=1 Tax=Mycobacterium phage LilSpotty TaxID=2588512 RepID=A0A4Y6EV65_9CAUD|nr:hypothetical protein QEH38_gp77 [Mycobacterium phage LilSpotty]QDF19809.1 hypothetical protein SEA_LILSPOTTY_77 [Mycobacterium phage LilSpotty]